MVGWILMLRTVVIFEIRNDVLIKPCLELGSHTCGRLRLQGSHVFYYLFMEAVDLKMITNNFNSMILWLVGLLFRVLCVSAVTQEQSKMALRKQKLIDVASESQQEEDSQEDEAADEQVKKRERPE